MGDVIYFEKRGDHTLKLYAGTVMTSFYILSYLHIVAGSKQTKKTLNMMNRMIAHYLCVSVTNKKDMAF